jgi:hypothetical protein
MHSKANNYTNQYDVLRIYSDLKTLHCTKSPKCTGEVVEINNYSNCSGEENTIV